MASVKQQMEVATAAKVLKLLGDKTRLTMVALMLEDECCVCEFVELFQMSQPSISQHLRKLRDVGLIEEERRGQWIFFRVNKKHEAYDMVASLLNHIPDQTERLRELEKDGLRVCCD
ncbi:ArsR/SmtB family transcription factor [Halalkalibacterium halodurans]|uniref:ArsR family transcriptional regulator n=1 Tax=Halalkalibacterium halodurans TaxID=86665 RepID=A0A0M0KHE7_ALKHA|nr:metalloregulator ArsR/SmtB family transcription factor [Halalkalibacterium halodurans]MDY7223546.1 metalloregulator ArsR/SmtB family transcription factor [Halalkalibacterium halodurans]MDY7242767.1 metalloregulator ArsR/SmtB family transcription factor [Halalkalibacterium halodurans]TES51586.1 ArsR family transcriptional regulator [Halalkalibacterium halodurans]TPE68122.1 winged helix-turn-helix transcriptional regulator [Halalkalibacterium halodurans]